MDSFFVPAFLNQLILEGAHNKDAKLWQLASLLLKCGHLLGALLGQGVHAGERAQHHFPPGLCGGWEGLLSVVITTIRAGPGHWLR